MNCRAINAAAGVILAAQEQGRLAAGIALALDSARLLNSPEQAAELQQLRERVADLEAERAESRPVDEDPIAYALTSVAEPLLTDDVAPQVRKLRALLAGQQQQTGGAL
ncbi:hypothetical protein ACOKM5_23255 [Streptomyces sp. BH097]|uniref:hypothetical protein n=1 Tax=unclassified Streptomyces TaxID=2593676 RepID=UPI003BB798E9